MPNRGGPPAAGRTHFPVVFRSIISLSALLSLGVLGCQSPPITSVASNRSHARPSSANWRPTLSAHGDATPKSAESDNLLPDRSTEPSGGNAVELVSSTAPTGDENRNAHASDAIDQADIEQPHRLAQAELAPPPAPATDDDLDPLEFSQFDAGNETLEQAWAVALAVDQRIQASRWKTSAAQRGLFAARAERFPTASMTSAYIAANKPPVFKTPKIQFAERDFITAGLNASQPLLTFGRISNAIESAGATVTAAQSEEVVTELDIKLLVAEAYIGVLRFVRLVEVAEAAVESLEEHERVVANRVERGIGVRNDLLAVQVEVANARQRLLEANNALETVKSAYNRALGRPLTAFVALADLTDLQAAEDEQSLTSRALGQRPEVAVLSAQVRALRRRADSVRAGNLPQFLLLGDYTFIENRFNLNEDIATVSVLGDWNFFDSGRNRHQAAELDQTAEGLIRLRTDVETFIALQVRQAWLELESTRERIEVNRTALESANENLRISRNRYGEGAVINTVVLDAVTLRTDAYNRFYTSVYDAILASIKLRRAVGEL